jgi:hypothetical protein
MSGTIFALVLFGCSDDGTLCERLSNAPKLYDSQVLCEADIDTALASEVAVRADYPSVLARCLPSAQVSRLDHGPIDLTTLDPIKARLAALQPPER